MRKPGFRDAWIAMKLYDLRREDEMRKARDLVGELISGGFDDIRPLLEYQHPRNQHLRQAVSYWEMAASFVQRGVFHPDLYLDTCDEGIFTFAVLEEHLSRIREIRPNFLAKTEAVIQEHPALKGRLMEVRQRIFRAKDRREEEADREP